MFLECGDDISDTISDLNINKHHLTKCSTFFEEKFPHFYLFAWKNPIHLFHSCTKKNFFWTQLQHSFQNVLIIPPITPQSTIFGFIDHKVNYHLINHILLIFKYHAYNTRKNGSLDIKVLKRNIHKIKDIEKQISLSKREKRKHFKQK